MLHILTLSILFFDTAGAKKRIKRNAEKVFSVVLDGEFEDTKMSAEKTLVFSADLWYNGMGDENGS